MSTPLLPTPWMYGRRRLTRIEVAIYAVVVATLVTVFFSTVTDYMEMAEKTAMESTLGNVTAAINLRYATLVLRGEAPRAAEWAARNPFELAQTFPPSYRGRLDGAARGAPERPAWLFDAARRELVYLPRSHSRLDGGSRDELRFRLEPHPSGFGFALAPTAPYQWSD